jgi:hypothetical protein
MTVTILATVFVSTLLEKEAALRLVLVKRTRAGGRGD